MMHEFVLLDSSPLELANGQLHRYQHKTSGVTVLYMETADVEKTFTLQFRTLPESHNGVCHIIEHAVFCGSRRYNVKDPFAELAKVSLNTYLNAITYPDRTVYPFATTNEQEYFNLLDIYLDAVFHPNFVTDQRILAQEGWHYEYDEVGDLTINGIVYNEMKGLLSSPENALNTLVLNRLFDNSYKWHAAGNPKDIPNLTHEEMVDFYNRHYHPSQAVIAVYGNLNIEAVLDRIAPYLDREGETPPSLVEQLPTTFSEEAVLYESYPSLSPDNSLSTTGIGIAHSRFDNVIDNLGLRMLTSILFTMESSPIKQVLINQQMVSDLYANFDDSLLTPYTMVTLLDSYGQDIPNIQEIIRSEMERLVVEGFDQHLVQSVINQWQFLLLEGFEDQGLPKGIMLSLDALSHLDRGLSPAEKLDYTRLLTSIIEKSNQGYFEDLLQTYYLDNPHWLYLSLEPSEECYKMETREAKQHLLTYQDVLTDQESEQIELGLAALKHMQETPNSLEALASIPTLSITDLSPTIQTCPYERVDHEIEAYQVSHRTRAIQQVSILFPQRQLAVEDMPYVNILCSLLGYLGTNQRDAYLLSNEIADKTGTTYFWARIFQKNDEEPYVAIQFFSKYLKDHEGAVLDLFEDMAYQTLWSDEDRIYQVLANLLNQFEYDLLDKSGELAVYRLKSYLDAKGIAESYLSGMDFYFVLRDLLEHFEENKEELVSRLQKLYTAAFPKETVRVVYHGDEVQSFLNHLSKRLQTPSISKIEDRISQKQTLTNHREAFVINGEVNAVALGYNFKHLGHPYSGSLEVARKILNAEYLWDTIRVLGGAYGAELMVMMDGSLIATSHRDPNVETTLQAMKGMGQYLRNLSDHYETIDGFIVGTIGELSRPISDSDRIHYVISALFDGYTDELRQQLYSEVLACRLDDLKVVADLLDEAMSLDYQVAFITPEKTSEACHEFKLIYLQSDGTEDL